MGGNVRFVFTFGLSIETLAEKALEEESVVRTILCVEYIVASRKER